MSTFATDKALPATEVVPVALSQKLVSSLIARPDFYSRLPEFSHIKSRVDAAKAVMTGCRSCFQRKADDQVFAAFSAALLSLGTDRLQAFKNYAGIVKIQYQGFNRLTGKYEVKII